MNPSYRILVLIALCFAGCDTRQKFEPAPPPTPPMGPPAQRISGGERLRADDAMTLSDLSLLLRTSTPEDEIMQHIARRGFLEPVGAVQAQGLAALGASPRLVIVVQDPQYVLGAAERQAYLARKTQRVTAARGKTAADRKAIEAEFAERQRQFELQQQTYDMVAQKERDAQAREQAKAAYERRRKSLESEIELLQKRINDYRRYGYNEAQLTEMNQRLKARRDELFNLRAP